MNRERLKTFFFTLLQAYSPYKQERAAADVIARILRELNVQYIEDDTAKLTGCNCGNIIVAGSSRARISFCAHMDTIRIYDRHEIQEADELIHAADSGVIGIDDKSGAAVLLETIAIMQETSGIPDDVHFIFTTCEEGGFLGAKYVNARHISDALNYVVDSGGVPIGYSVNEGVGQYDFRIGLTGKMSHTGGAAGMNSLVLAAELICTLETGRISEKTFINISGINCESNPNTIPGYTEFTGQVLSSDDEEAKYVLEQMKKYADEFVKKHSCHVSFSYECTCERFFTEESSEIVKYARTAAEKAGLEFRLGRTGAGSDAHVFKQRGAQTLKISTGMMNVHSMDEYIRLDDMEKCVKYVLALAGNDRD